MEYRVHTICLMIFLMLCSYICFASGQDSTFFSFGKNGDKGHKLGKQTPWPFSNEGITYGLSGVFEQKDSYCTTADSFAFWMELPAGNYRVTIVLGDQNGNSNATVRAESRRLMIYDHSTRKGKIDTLHFIVNVRNAIIDGKDSINLNRRELEYLNWDKNLTLEFAGERPCIRSLKITRHETIPTIFLAGNSTVVDQEMEPWASWGQIFPLFLKPTISVANFAESGESLKSFVRTGRLKKIASLIKPGDYLFMEFAHNDQKAGGNHVEPYSTYEEYLLKFINVARAHGATPVLVTSTNRRKFDENGQIVNTLEDYPDAMRQLAREEEIHLIDLNKMSKTLFEVLGIEGSKKAFVHYEAGAFSWQQEPLEDNTHFSTYGAWQLAKCVVKGIRELDDPLKTFVKRELEDYEPDQPDPLTEWNWPVLKYGSVSNYEWE